MSDTPFPIKRSGDRYVVAGGQIGSRYVNETAVMNKSRAKEIQAARRRMRIKHRR